MFFLLSGEGVTDLGVGKVEKVICEANDYFPGPLAIMVEQIVEARQSHSLLDGACGYVSESHLANRAGELKSAKKGLRLPGKKRAKETRYFFNNARVLSRIAKEKEAELNEEVVAILFRDSDGTATAGRGLWSEKRKSMLDGFAEEGFLRGVPMIPRPKSEAWLICALKKQPYQGCEKLEERSGNDNSPNSLKGDLQEFLGEEVTPELLCEKVRQKAVDFARIEMTSFAAFRERLEAVI